MAPGVAGSIPVSHPFEIYELRAVLSAVRVVAFRTGVDRSVAQLVEHRSPKPGVAGSIPAGPVSVFFFACAWRYRLGD